MFKLIFSSLTFMTLSAGFLFSKEKGDHPCKQSLSGIVRESGDKSDFHLLIESSDHKMYLPVIEKDDVVLASGTKVRVCYDMLDENSTVRRIRINHVSYLP